MNRRDILKHLSAAPFFTMFINKRKAWAGSTTEPALIVDEAAPSMENQTDKPEPSILNNWNRDARTQCFVHIRGALASALGYVTFHKTFHEPDRAAAVTARWIEGAVEAVDMLQFRIAPAPRIKPSTQLYDRKVRGPVPIRKRPPETSVPTKTLDNLAYSLTTAMFGIDLYERANGRTDDTQRMLKNLDTTQKELFHLLGYRVYPGD